MDLGKLVSLTVRNILCHAPRLHLVPLPERPEGISLFIETKNPEWIDLSLRSVKDFADEIVIVDTSSDDTPERILNVAEKYGLNVKLIRMEDNSLSPLSNEETLTKQCNLALKNTTYNWVFHWGSDFIARTSGPYDIKKLREKILNLDSSKYYMVYLSFVNLHCDIFHTIPGGVGLSGEAHLFTYSKNLEFKKVKGFARLELPKYYKPIYINDVFIFHLATVKNSRHLLYHWYWRDWRRLGDYTRFPTIVEYTKYRLKLDYGISDLSEGEKIIVKELCKKIIPYDKQKYGEYPELLKEELENPRYRVIYKDGKIVGRNDVL